MAAGVLVAEAVQSSNAAAIGDHPTLAHAAASAAMKSARLTRAKGLLGCARAAAIGGDSDDGERDEESKTRKYVR